MSEGASDDSMGSPVEVVRKIIVVSWRNMKSIYYANTMSWRVMKSGALLFFGFFLWTSSNILLSYHENWSFMYFPMAYGFLLILWGPLTHFVMVPLTIRLRRQGKKLGKYLTKINLSVFLILVLVLTLLPPGVMTFEFQSGGGGAPDVNPDLLCTMGTNELDEVHCHLSDSQGISTVVVSSGEKEIDRDEDPPFQFTFGTDQLSESAGEKVFTVELRDENGDLLRRYRKRVSQIG